MPQLPFHSLHSKPVPILTRGGETVVLLAGRPKDPSYEDALVDLEASVTEAGKNFHFSEYQRDNRRGDYLAISTGISFGGGSMVWVWGQARHLQKLTLVSRLQDH